MKHPTKHPMAVLYGKIPHPMYLKNLSRQIVAQNTFEIETVYKRQGLNKLEGPQVVVLILLQNQLGGFGLVILSQSQKEGSGKMKISENISKKTVRISPASCQAYKLIEYACTHTYAHRKHSAYIQNHLQLAQPSDYWKQH